MGKCNWYLHPEIREAYALEGLAEQFGMKLQLEARIAGPIVVARGLVGRIFGMTIIIPGFFKGKFYRKSTTPNRRYAKMGKYGKFNGKIWDLQEFNRKIYRKYGFR